MLVTIAGGTVKDAVAITPSDTVDLSKVTSGLYVGGTGDVSVILESGNTVTFKTLSAGIVHPIAIKRVRATLTTATNLLAVY